MKLEMEQMKAERQKSKIVEVSTVSEVEKSKRKTEKKFADIIDFRKSPVKSFDDGRKFDMDELFKPQKENIECKKPSESTTSQSFPRYMRMENKPSVRELLSKFEGRNNFDDNAQKFNNDTIHNSPPKHSTNVFSNVQVRNHNYPLTPSKSASSNICGRNTNTEDNPTSLSKEHIFQTECVIRFPHPKTSILSQIQNESPKNSLGNRHVTQDAVESNSWSSGQYDHHTKQNNSRTSCMSSDNISTYPKSPGRRNDFSTPLFRDNSASEQSRLSRSVESRRTFPNDKSREDATDKTNKLQRDDNSFSSFKDTFNRANRLTAQMRNEFLQRGLPQSEQPDNGNWSFFTQQGDYHLSGSPPVSRRRQQPPTRQRPKSVPPPTSRLSLANQSPAVQASSHTTFIPPESLQNVPKPSSGVSLSNGKDTSQTYGPPKRVRDRAAIFERSMSFSGHVDSKTHSSDHKQKAQKDSSAR